MTNTAITNLNSELIKNHIVQLLDRLTTEYQNTLEERKEIASETKPSENEFTLLEEIELFTTDIRGYANQIKAIGDIKKTQQAIKKLQEMRVLNIPIIVQFYFNSSHPYEKIKSYLRMLDYLRLLILEYLSLSEIGQ